MSTLTEWTDRWTSFRGKIEARLKTVSDEALAAYTQIAATSPLEHAPVAALEGAVQARYNGLGSKLDEAFETIDAGIDALLDDTDKSAVMKRLSQARDRMSDERGALAVRIDREEQVCKVRGAALVARAIEPLAEGEDPTQSCVQCGAPFDPGPVFQSTSVSCPHCNARLTVGPRPAKLEWYSRGVSALAEEEALPIWLAYRDAHDRYGALRHPVASDLEAVERAYEAYHRAVFAVLVARHPAWTEDEAERQIQGRVAQLRSMETRFQPTALQRTGEGLEVARRRDPKALSAWVASTTGAVGRHTLLDDLLEAAVERADRVAAETLVQVVHADELPWLGRQRWVRNKLRELSDSFV